MELKRLKQTDIENLKTGRVFLVKYNPAYIKEIYGQYEDFPKIKGILDESTRSQGRKNVNGSEVMAYPFSHITELPKDSVLVITDGYFEEYYEEILKYGDISNIGDTIYFYANRDTEYYLSYKEKYKDTPLKDIVVFRSGPAAVSYVHGTDYADNARALFEYMLLSGLNKRYRLVWLVRYPNEFADIEENNENVRFLSFDDAVSDKKEKRDEYYENLCLAKYIFMTDAYGFCRYARNDQIRVQLWHGCGFKTRVNFVRCEKRYEYNIVISRLYAKIHAEIYGLRDDQLLVTGYPKEDLLFRINDDWGKRLGIPKAEKYIFWLPTFRTPVKQLSELDEKKPEGATGLPLIKTKKQLNELDGFLSINDAVLIIKPHPFQSIEAINALSTKNIVLIDNDGIYDNGFQINELLPYADALISDYSSAAVDFLLLDKPIGFTLDDVDEYEESRGFVFNPIRDWLPGKELYTFEDFKDFIKEVLNGIDSTKDKRRAIAEKMHDFNDDKSSERVLKTLHIID